MTSRLYYTDAQTLAFQARVTDRVTQNGRSALILDQTYFYPTSGGQPHDIGTLAGLPVIDVTVREPDQAILHWLDPAAPGDGVTVETAVDGRIHAPRRRDHMQQHSGQHLLTQAFIRVTGAETVSFHLSENSVTIDLDGAQPTAAQLDEAEDLANAIIAENRPIQVRMLTPEEAAAIPVRKLPQVEHGVIRLVEIEDFDLTACGGTHVAQTGGIGLIKTTKVEKRGAYWRVTFVCGERALRDYRQKHTIVSQLMAELTTAADELAPTVDRLRSENKTLQRALKAKTAALLTYEAKALWQQGTVVNGRLCCVTHVFADMDGNDLRAMAQELTRQPRTAVFLAAAGDKAAYVFARSADVSGHMGQLLRAVLQEIGGGGGGSDQMAQGGGPPAAAEQLAAHLNLAQERWLAAHQSAVQ